MKKVFEAIDAEQLVEYEVYVDKDGYAMDDDGNRWFAGMQYASGTYGINQIPVPGGGGSGRRSGSRYGRGYGKVPKRSPSGKDMEMIAALDLALKKRKLGFLESIRDQLRQGRSLSGKQQVAVRRNLHQMKMHDEAKLFESIGEVAMDKDIEVLDACIMEPIDEKRTGFVFPKREGEGGKKGAWPIGDKKHAKIAISYMAAGRGKKADYPSIRSAIKSKYGKDASIMDSLKKLGEDDESLALEAKEHDGYPIGEASYRDGLDLLSKIREGEAELDLPYSELPSEDSIMDHPTKYTANLKKILAIQGKIRKLQADYKKASAY